MTMSPLAMFAAASLTLSAQWLDHKTPGIPRTLEGKPNLVAPAPKASDGKPDLSGLWGMNPGAYRANIATDLKPGDVQPWAQALFEKRAAELAKDDPAQAECLPQGPRANLYSPLLEKIVQTPSLMLFLLEDLSYRQVFMDGRTLPNNPNPSFMGYSVGHWEGDALIVESFGYNDRTWIDMTGHPHTEALRLTERLRRRDYGHMDIEETIDDPKAFSKPFTISIKAELVPDTELLEYVCAENERDPRHVVGKTSDAPKVGVKVASEILSAYVGSYDFRYPENPTVPVIMHVTMTGGELLLDTEGKGRVPLNPLTETIFSTATGTRMEFIKNPQGVVTHFVTMYAEGDLEAVRLRGDK